MRILITGGGGFLAGHVSAHLQTIAGIEVRSLRRAECDLARDKEKLSMALQSFQPEAIVHLAGRIGGSESELDRDNRCATVNLLESVRRNLSTSKIVIGSTTAVYRDSGTPAAPLTEAQPADPRGPYAASKCAAEQEVASYSAGGGCVVTARISNPVGSNMNAALLCGTLGKQIVEIERGKRPIITLRDLTPKRDFISARDCAVALWRLIEVGRPGAIYNVASGISISIAEIVNMYLRSARIHPIDVNVLPVEGERSSVKEQWISNAELLALGWKPQETLQDAVSSQLDAERARA